MNSLRGSIKEGKTSWKIITTLHSLFRCNSTNAAKIKIPNRIERGPTDILKALESTITRDPTAMPYKYIDDPYLMPHSNYTKRTYLLSMESGRKAAIWIRQQHADLFQHKEAEPFIQAFIPKVVYTDKSQVSEEILLNAINKAQVEDATNIYNLLDGDVSDETKLAYFQMLCYYNNEEPTSTEYLQEKWFRNQVSPHLIWSENAVINELFSYLTKRNPDIAAAAYNTLICAYVKYGKIGKVKPLVDECQDKGYLFNVNTYNKLIYMISVEVADLRKKWTLINDLLYKMNVDKVLPNVQTLNTCLEVIANTSSYNEETFSFIHILLNKFRKNGIEPCLTSYYYILIAMRKKEHLVSSILDEIMNKVEKEGELEIKDSKDTLFFTTAMSVACQTIDLNLANRIHNCLLCKNNYKFIGNGNMESIYYRYYTNILLTTKPLLEFVEIYEKLVPNVYIPEMFVILEILKAMENNPPEQLVNIIPTMWSHIVMFDYTSKPKIMRQFFEIMLSVSDSLPMDENVKNEHVTIVSKYFELILEQNPKNKLIQMDAGVFGIMLILFSRNDMFDKVIKVFNFMHQNYKIIIDTISEERLIELLDECVSRGHIQASFYTLEYGIDCGYERLKKCGKRVESLPLSSKEKILLRSLLGEDMKEDSQENQTSSV